MPTESHSVALVWNMPYSRYGGGIATDFLVLLWDTGTSPSIPAPAGPIRGSEISTPCLSSSSSRRVHVCRTRLLTFWAGRWACWKTRFEWCALSAPTPSPPTITHTYHTQGGMEICYVIDGSSCVAAVLGHPFLFLPPGFSPFCLARGFNSSCLGWFPSCRFPREFLVSGHFGKGGLQKATLH